MPLQITHIGPGTTDPNLIGAYNVETSTFYSGYNPLQLMESVLQPDHRVDKFYLDNLGEETAKVFGHNLTLDWQAGPLEIKSITGYREYDSDLPRNDLDGGSWETADGVAVPMFHTADTKQQEGRRLGNDRSLSHQVVVTATHGEVCVEICCMPKKREIKAGQSIMTAT